MAHCHWCRGNTLTYLFSNVVKAKTSTLKAEAWTFEAEAFNPLIPH